MPENSLLRDLWCDCLFCCLERVTGCRKISISKIRGLYSWSLVQIKLCDVIFCKIQECKLRFTRLSFFYILILSQYNIKIILKVYKFIKKRSKPRYIMICFFLYLDSSHQKNLILFTAVQQYQLCLRLQFHLQQWYLSQPVARSQFLWRCCQCLCFH